MNAVALLSSLLRHVEHPSDLLPRGPVTLAGIILAAATVGAVRVAAWVWGRR